MNDKFFKLDQLKQDAIINAALKVFSLHEYKQANTNDIAAEAAISKGLLFHYFGSKKNLYLFLYRYSMSIVKEQMQPDIVIPNTDFFELLINAQQRKTSIMLRYPYIFAFGLKAYYEEDDAVASEIASYNLQSIDANSEAILAYADLSQFKSDVSPQQALNIVMWCSEGFMKAKLQQEPLNIQAINDEFVEYLQLLKRSFYKNE